ncbi:microfibril-associated glycoprotein 4-like isoform X1 [Ciona intestinalis]
MDIMMITYVLVLFTIYCADLGVHSVGRGSTDIWCESNKERKNISVTYRMCLNDVPVFVNVTRVKPSDSSQPHQFNTNVKQIESYGFLAEISRIDINSGWNSMSLTVEWVIYMKTDLSSCQKLYDNGYRRNGLYNIYPDEITKLEAYCDLENHGGGWTVIQRNVDRGTHFDRDWTDYITGFGNKTGSFWIGLENIRELTRNGDHELRIDMTTCNNTNITAEYSKFMVGPESDRYRLTITGFQHKQGTQCDQGARWPCGNENITKSQCENTSQDCCYFENATGADRCRHTADAMAWTNGFQFSTRDRNNKKCADTRSGGWWYTQCTFASLNGKNEPCGRGAANAYWRNWIAAGTHEGLRYTQMKIRPLRNS